MGPVKICNCAECNVKMSKSLTTKVKDVVPLGGRIKDRPYCGECLVSYHGIGGRSGIFKGEPSPGWENAIKAMEDGR